MTLNNPGCDAFAFCSRSRFKGKRTWAATKMKFFGRRHWNVQSSNITLRFSFETRGPESRKKQRCIIVSGWNSEAIRRFPIVSIWKLGRDRPEGNQPKNAHMSPTINFAKSCLGRVLGVTKSFGGGDHFVGRR